MATAAFSIPSRPGKLPALQFYPGDWLRDPGVQSLTYHDQGVWLKLLCFMHESHQRGKLLLNGRAMTHPEMSRLLGLEVSVVESTVENLLDSGVGSIDEETGALISRRMVRDEEGRQQRKMWGRDGGRSAAAADTGQERPGFLFLVRRESDGMMRIGSSVNPQNRLYRLRFENRGETLVLLAKRAVDNMRTALSSFAAEHGIHAHEWFARAKETVSSFLSSFLSSSQEDGAFLPPSSVSSSTSIPKERESKAQATADADLHPLAAQIVLAHPFARRRNWTVRDIPVDCVVAVLAAIRAEAEETGASKSAAATMILTLVRGIASDVPEEEWRFLKQIPEFMRLRDYRIDPKHLTNRGGNRNGTTGPNPVSGTHPAPAVQRQRESFAAIGGAIARRYGSRHHANDGANGGEVAEAAAARADVGHVSGGVGVHDPAVLPSGVSGRTIEGQPRSQPSPVLPRTA